MTQKYEASDSAIRRLPRYYRLLQELERTGQAHTSSSELGRKLGMTASQIRQDLRCFGCFGQQGSGYAVQTLRENLEQVMGLSQCIPMILLGAGSLGKVVSENVRFEQRGFQLIGIFDIKPDLIGRKLANLEIRSMKTLETFCQEHRPQAAALCLPKESAQQAAEQLQRCGICGLWNFSHGDISVENVQVVTVHLDDSLMTLSYKLHNRER